MIHAIKHITAKLKAGRELKQLSQRELSGKVGMPQGHISRIENAAVDLRLSNLIELARVLDLELMLVPRKLVPAVTGTIAAATGTAASATAKPQRAYTLDDDESDG